MNQIPNIEETHNTREVEEWEREFVEHGASLEHERWANWQNYLHSKLTFNGKDWVLPNELYERWQRQIDTPYADLSEAEKESDRKEARTYLPLVHHQLQKVRDQEAKFWFETWYSHYIAPEKPLAREFGKFATERIQMTGYLRDQSKLDQDKK